MFQTSVLASGSKGNCTLVRTDKTAVLFDAGLSFKRTCEAIEQLAVTSNDLSAVVISHEHSDHINGIGPICRKLRIPVYISKPTFDHCCSKLSNIPSEIVFFKHGEYLTIEDLEIHPFPCSHDAIDASNFTIRKKTDNKHLASRKLAIATDLGFCTRLLVNKVKDATTIILESNHDIQMLMNGKYDWKLKQRVKSINGHLSNEQAIGLLTQIFHPLLDNIILAHLSEENNHPEIVEKLFTCYLASIKAKTRLTISCQKRSTPLLDI